MASGWESEGLGLKHWQIQATFDPGLPKKIQQKIFPTLHCAFHDLFCKAHSKRLKNVFYIFFFAITF